MCNSQMTVLFRLVSGCDLFTRPSNRVRAAPLVRRGSRAPPVWAGRPGPWDGGAGADCADRRDTAASSAYPARKEIREKRASLA